MISLNVRSDFRFPFVSIVQQFLLVVQQLFMALCGELEVWSFNDRIDRTGFLKSENYNCRI